MVLNFLEILIGSLNLVLAVIVVRTNYKVNELEQSIQEQQLRVMLEQDEDLKEKKKRLMTVSVGLFVSSIFRAARTVVMEILISSSKNYVCKQGLYFQAQNNVTELFVWYVFLVSIIPTILLFYVIYYMPNRSGQVSNVNKKKHGVNVSNIDIEIAIEKEYNS